MYNIFDSLRSRILSAILIAGVFFSQSASAQVVKVLDSLTKVGISDFYIAIGDHKLSSGGRGFVSLDKVNKEKFITINHIGYTSRSFPFPAKDTTLLLSEHVIRLGEVIIVSGKGEKVTVGNFKKKTNNVLVNTKVDQDIGFTVVNRFHYRNEQIKAILFYIFKDENYAKSTDLSPIEVVFFKANAKGYPEKEPFHKVMVNNYAMGWNKVLVDDLTIGDEAVLFYGIKWIYDPVKYHYKNINRKRVYTFFGCKLGVAANNKLPDFHQTFFFTNERGWRMSDFSLAMMALELIK